jgi:hypothetical protein
MDSDKVVVVFIPVRKGMMKQMQAFYGDTLGFTINRSQFLVKNIEAVRG